MKFLSYTLEGLIEFLLILLHFPLFLLVHIFPFKTENKNPTQKYPIIFVERWFRSNVLHLIPKMYLESKGFQVYKISYKLTSSTFEEGARCLSEFIEEKNLKNVVLVGLSTGGVVVLEYLQNQNGWNKSHLFISIGSPLHGSKLAHFAKISEMYPNSVFFQNLYKNDIKNPEKIYTISAKIDNMVGRSNSRLKGVTNITLDMFGHNLLHTLYIPTYKKVVDIIRNS